MPDNNYMQLLNVEELLDTYNFIVPEIQREYVWGNNVNEILSIFIEDIKEGKAQALATADVEKRLNELLQHGKADEIDRLINNLQHLSEVKDGKSLNIGFLYSYRPDYYFYDDVSIDAYLIDGQQRLTTLVLLLFYFSIKEQRQVDFKALIRFDAATEHIAFDYRVRNITHRFLFDLISRCNTLHDIENVKERTWFLSAYGTDVTVKAMVSALEIINKAFASDETNYYDYVKSGVRFWHFKTEETDQGEELYITMNSRGKQLADNENLHALLFETEEAKTDEKGWSIQWEEWQDFFWKHKQEDESSADRGFDNFLNCVAGLEAYLKGGSSSFNSDAKPPVKKVKQYLSLSAIQNHFEAVKYLLNEESINTFKAQYEYCDWLDESLEKFKDVMFHSDTKWFVDYNDQNLGTERNRMVFIWSWLMYYDEAVKTDNLTPANGYRFLRLFWLKFNNYIRSVKLLRELIPQKLQNGIWSAGETEEERLKHAYLIEIDGEKALRPIEAAIWKIEDHPINLNGRDVGGINSSHLVDYPSGPDLKVLQYIGDRFNCLFPDNANYISNALKNVLLFYGDYSTENKTGNYVNRDFGDERKIVRGDVFKQFFENYKGEELDEIWEEKKREFIAKHREDIKNATDRLPFNDRLTTLQLYSVLLQSSMWEFGSHIAIGAESIDSYEEQGINNYGLTVFEAVNGSIENTNGKRYTRLNLWMKITNEGEDCNAPLEKLKAMLD